MVRMDADGNIYYLKGDTFLLNFINVKEEGTIIDWTNWDIKLKIFKGNTTILELTKNNGINLSINGAIKILQTPTQMNALKFGEYLYDLIVTRPDGTVETWLNNKKFIVE